MKKIFLILLLLVLPSSVFANEQQYVNDNGIQISEEEYNFINEFYGNDFFDKMTQEEYEWIEDLNLTSSDVSISTYYEPIMNTRASTHSTSNKKISIAKSCANKCTIITKVEWFSNPKIRSYDVIGARLYNTELFDDNITTKLISSDGSSFSSNTKILSDGFGVSVKLPSTATDIRIEQKFYTNSSGTVFASYQHATQNISLATSKLYTIDISGEGGVFDFYGNATGVFDQMAGVSISL